MGFENEWGESSCIFCVHRLSKWRQAALIGDCSHLLATIIKKGGEKNTKIESVLLFDMRKNDDA